MRTTDLERALRRIPIASAAVMAITILVLTSVTIEVNAADDTNTSTWATVLVFVGIACAVVGSWFIRHHFDALADWPDQHGCPGHDGPRTVD